MGTIASLRLRRRQVLSGDLAPAHREVIVDVEHGRAANTRADVVPAQLAPCGMVAGVEAVAAEVGDVDAADERDLAVHHHGLLVMAVEWMLARVGHAADPRPAREHLDGVTYLAAGGTKSRHGGAGPDQDPHIEPLCRLREHWPQRSRALAAHQVEMWSEVPAGHVDEVARSLDRLSDSREGLGAIDQDVHRAARARRWIACCPQSVIGRRK